MPASLVVVTVLVPFTATVAPDSGSPVVFLVTLPVTCIVCACTWLSIQSTSVMLNKNRIIHFICSYFLNFLIPVYWTWSCWPHAEYAGNAEVFPLNLYVR